MSFEPWVYLSHFSLKKIQDKVIQEYMTHYSIQLLKKLNPLIQIMLKQK